MHILHLTTITLAIQCLNTGFTNFSSHNDTIVSYL